MKTSNSVSFFNGPEVNIAAFGLLLNFPWEMWQAPLYEGMAEASHLAALTRCSIAATGDAAILVAAFLATAALAKTRAWVLQPPRRDIALFIAFGLAITIGIERLATAAHIPGWTWRYGDMMPVIPLLGIGAVPFAQWILIPLATLWVVRRQLTHDDLLRTQVQRQADEQKDVTLSGN